MMVRGQFAQLMAPGIHYNFVEWLELLQREEEYQAVFHTETTDKPFVDEVQYFGLGPMPEKTENDSVAYYDAVQGGTKRYIPLTYAMGSRISWELYDDDQYGIIKQVPKAQARSARFTREQTAWNVFNNGFSTIVTTDGVSLFNNQHPLKGGAVATQTGPGLGSIISAAGTYPNRPAVDVDLSFTAIQLMTNHFERFVDSMGLPAVIKPKMLVLPPALRFTARELLGSPGKPGTANNDINSLLGEDLSWMIGHYLTSDSAWFALSSKENHQLKFYTRKPLDADYDDDFDTRALKFISFMRFTVGATHWIGTWGSNGP